MYRLIRFILRGVRILGIALFASMIILAIMFAEDDNLSKRSDKAVSSSSARRVNAAPSKPFTRRAEILNFAPYKSPTSQDAFSYGTAFLIDSEETWFTARHVVDDCRNIYLSTHRDDSAANITIAVRDKTAKGKQKEFRFQVYRASTLGVDGNSDTALLVRQVSSKANKALRAKPLPVRLGKDAPLQGGEKGIAVGYPNRTPGEIAMVYIAEKPARHSFREGEVQHRLAVWSVVEASTHEEFGGISGGPTVDEAGSVVGINVGTNKRRSRFYTQAPDIMHTMLAKHRVGFTQAGYSKKGQAVSAIDYSAMARRFRDQNQVARVVCQY